MKPVKKKIEGSDKKVAIIMEGKIQFHTIVTVQTAAKVLQLIDTLEPQGQEVIKNA